jgi:hypothetical protein
MIPTMTQSPELNTLGQGYNVLHNFLTFGKILDNLVQIITIVRLCAYNMHGTTSRSWLVKGEEVHIHVQCGRGFSCPTDCLVIISFSSKIFSEV